MSRSSGGYFFDAGGFLSVKHAVSKTESLVVLANRSTKTLKRDMTTHQFSKNLSLPTTGGFDPCVALLEGEIYCCAADDGS